jgi:GTP pyrophosphokinase
LQLEATVAKGRDAVEKLLQREGKTALNLDDLAAQLGFKTAENLFEVVGKDEYSVRTIEQFLRPALPQPDQDAALLHKRHRHDEKISTKGNVLVVGVDSLLTQLAKCCKPAPPDAIIGYVTRGKGVSIHRERCVTLKKLLEKEGERLVDVAWGTPKSGSVYAMDLRLLGTERPGLLRDITELFNKEKIPIRGVQQQIVHRGGKNTCVMTLTVDVRDAGELGKVLSGVMLVSGIEGARRI